MIVSIPILNFKYEKLVSLVEPEYFESILDQSDTISSHNTQSIKQWRKANNLD